MKCPICLLVMALEDVSVTTHYKTPDEGTAEYIYKCTCGALLSFSGKYWKKEVDA